MIAYLQGRLAQALPTQVVVDVGGVGYEVFIPLSSFDKLPQPGGEVKLLTHLSIRDDAHVLYGFMTDCERDLFRLLIRHVSGIGPKIALNVLSGTTTASLRSAVTNGDVKALSRINGVGKKTAERIGLELKDKLPATPVIEQVEGETPSHDGDLRGDVLSALLNLGYHRALAERALDSAMKVGDGDVEQMLRQALRELAK